MSEMWKSAKRQSRDCPGIELNGQSLEIVGRFCYLGGKIGLKGGAVC